MKSVKLQFAIIRHRSAKRHHWHDERRDRIVGESADCKSDVHRHGYCACARFNRHDLGYERDDHELLQTHSYELGRFYGAWNVV
jgi:hypothetical protein